MSYDHIDEIVVSSFKKYLRETASAEAAATLVLSEAIFNHTKHLGV